MAMSKKQIAAMIVQKKKSLELAKAKVKTVIDEIKKLKENLKLAKQIECVAC